MTGFSLTLAVTLPFSVTWMVLVSGSKTQEPSRLMARALCRPEVRQELNYLNSTHIEALPRYLEGDRPVRHDGGRDDVRQGDELLLPDVDRLDVEMFGVASVVLPGPAGVGQLGHLVEADPAAGGVGTVFLEDLRTRVETCRSEVMTSAI